MAIPAITDIAARASVLDHKNAKWGPLACSFHRGDSAPEGQSRLPANQRGFDKTCEACAAQAQATIEHVLAAAGA